MAFASKWGGVGSPPLKRIAANRRSLIRVYPDPASGLTLAWVKNFTDDGVTHLLGAAVA